MRMFQYHSKMELYVCMGSGLLLAISKSRDSTVLLEGFSGKDVAVWGKKLLLIMGHWLDTSKFLEAVLGKTCVES